MSNIFYKHKLSFVLILFKLKPPEETICSILDLTHLQYFTASDRPRLETPVWDETVEKVI